MSDDEQHPLTDFAKQTGESLGALFAIGIFQAKAMNVLANAICSDPAVSDETKEAAKVCMEEVKNSVDQMNGALNETASKALREYLGIYE